MLKTILVIILLYPCLSFAAIDYLYILDDQCINDLYSEALFFFNDKQIDIIKDSRGLILRYEFEDPINEFDNLNSKVYKNFEHFLAKIKNPAIIEVHIKMFPNVRFENLKNWEVSTVMANNIEAVITEPFGTVEQNRINSIGYGEFLPAKNTSNNGGKYSNRVDIIILCNISGE